MPISIDERIKKSKSKLEEAIRFLDDLMEGGDIVNATHGARSCCLAAIKMLSIMEPEDGKQ